MDRGQPWASWTVGVSEAAAHNRGSSPSDSPCGSGIPAACYIAGRNNGCFDRTGLPRLVPAASPEPGEKSRWESVRFQRRRRYGAALEETRASGTLYLPANCALRYVALVSAFRACDIHEHGHTLPMTIARDKDAPPGPHKRRSRTDKPARSAQVAPDRDLMRGAGIVAGPATAPPVTVGLLLTPRILNSAQRAVNENPCSFSAALAATSPSAGRAAAPVTCRFSVHVRDHNSERTPPPQPPLIGYQFRAAGRCRVPGR